jgi:hypothetical protein
MVMGNKLEASNMFQIWYLFGVSMPLAIFRDTLVFIDQNYSDRACNALLSEAIILKSAFLLQKLLFPHIKILKMCISVNHRLMGW